jgi:GWT1
MQTSSELELASILAVHPISILAFSKFSNSHAADFLAIVVPQYLTIQFPALIPCYFVFCIVVIALRKKTLCNSEPNIYYDLVRSGLMIQTTICIFLCDFSFWVKKFGKSELYGLTLMDLGIGGFIFNTGMLSCKMKLGKIKHTIIILLVLGFIRLFAIKVFQLEVNPTEYGYHWNFYFTLAFLNILFYVHSHIVRSCIKFLCKFTNYEYFKNDETKSQHGSLNNESQHGSLNNIIESAKNMDKSCKARSANIGKNFINESHLKDKPSNNAGASSKDINLKEKNENRMIITEGGKLESSLIAEFNLCLGIALVVINEFILSKTQKSILNSDRSNIFMQNKEGLASVLPFFGALLILNYIGSILLSRRTLMVKIMYCICYFKIAVVFYIISTRYSLVSRRLCNLAFVSWSILFQLGCLGVSLISAKFLPHCIGEVQLIRFVSRNMMLLFLFSNLLVLIYKMIFNLETMGRLQGNLCNLSYLILNFIALPLISRKIGIAK